MNELMFQVNRSIFCMNDQETPQGPGTKEVEAFIQDVLDGHPEASGFFTPDATWSGGTAGTVTGGKNVAGLFDGSAAAALPDDWTAILYETGMYKAPWISCLTHKCENRRLIENPQARGRDEVLAPHAITGSRTLLRLASNLFSAKIRIERCGASSRARFARRDRRTWCGFAVSLGSCSARWGWCGSLKGRARCTARACRVTHRSRCSAGRPSSSGWRCWSGRS
jgi:hypothetical protein